MKLSRSVVLVASLLLVLIASAWSQNSYKKVRPKPSPLAAKAGMYVEWRPSLADALAEAKQTGKPVFWYVPTVAGSPTDRKTEIDRYMLAGPFSWPRTIDLLNAHYVPVRHIASRSERKAYGLERVKFIEPGYLILDGEGKELARENRITTFNPAWFLGPLAERVGAEVPLFGLPGSATSKGGEPERLFKEGLKRIHTGKLDEAFAVWGDLAKGFPDHALAAKVAMEMEGYGPLVRGFETYMHLPPGALVPSGDGTCVAPGVYGDLDLWDCGLEFLVKMQRANGGFDDSFYDFGGTDGLPNVHVAITAIIATALLERTAQPVEDLPLAEHVIQRALPYLADEANVNAEDTDEQIWAHHYRARCFTRWIALRSRDAERIRPLLERVCGRLVAMQTERGDWAHEYPNPFVTANCLIALHEAKQVGVEVPGTKEAIVAGVKALRRCRTLELAYTYYATRRGPARAKVEGSVGRAPLGELALSFCDTKGDADLNKALAQSFEHEEHLFAVRKYDDHASRYGYGGFFFWYDIHARVEAIAALPPGEARTDLIERQRAQILSLPEIDGCFVDSHENGRTYGTGMALWCLAILDRLG